MSFQSNIPQPTDAISKSQADILGNFTALAPFGNGFANLTDLGIAPTITGTNNGIYNLTNPTTGTTELYAHKQINGGTAEVPFTASKMSNTAYASCTNGWSYLPSGLLIKWGSFLVPSSNIFTVNVAGTSGGPNFTQVFNVQAIPYWAGPAAAGHYLTLSSFGSAPTGNFTCFVQGYSSTVSSYVNYLVIGV